MAQNPVSLRLKFWGVRGSTPTPMADHLGYGGNTTCMEILGGEGERIIIDAGTGIRQLGRTLGQDDNVDIFLTHFHWDHIQGLPFFVPLLTPGREVTFHSSRPVDETRRLLEMQMSDPYFTLEFKSVAGRPKFICLSDTLQHGCFAIKPFPLHHPQGATGYRIESAGKTIVVGTDFEHGDAELDRTLLEYAEGADVLIYDAQYTPAEYAMRKGWGHSTYAEAAKLACEAKVGQLVLFHHDPTHDDAAVDEIVEKTLPLFPNTIAAREQHVIEI